MKKIKVAKTNTSYKGLFKYSDDSASLSVKVWLEL